MVVQAESKAAIERIDDIAGVPGLDAIMIGPGDLSISLGVPGQTDDPAFVRCVEAVARACGERGIVSGMFVGDPERIRRYMQLGMRLFSCGGDIGLIRQAGTELVAKLRAVAQDVMG